MQRQTLTTVVITLGFLGSLFGGSASGQATSGVRIRLQVTDTYVSSSGSVVERRERFVIGRLVRRDSAGFVVQADSGEVVTIPAAAVTSVAVSQGRRSHELRGALLGLVSGAVAGAAIGLAEGDDPPCPTEAGPLCVFSPRFNAGDKAFISGSFFGLLGGALGYAIGRRVIEVWAPASLDAIAIDVVAVGGPVRFRLSVAF